jgi:LysR family hydrogen peroxide-inducible transcriptional activator
MQYSLVQVQYCLAVLRLGSFQKAAKACFVTQPTLSMQIQKLEEQLGIMLFDRSRKPIAPTEQGRAILSQFDVVMREVGRVEDVILRMRGEISGPYTLGIIPTLAPYLVPLFVAKFAKRFAKVKLQIRERTTHEIVADLKSGSLDGGILATPLHDPEISEVDLFREPFYVYQSKALQLPVDQHRRIAIDKLPLEKILVLDEGHCLRTQVLDLCGMRQDGPLLLTAASLMTLMRAVDAGGGFSIVPYLATTPLSAHAQEQQVLEIAGVEPYRQIGLVTHRSFVKAALHNAVADFARSEVEIPKLARRGQLMEPQ